MGYLLDTNILAELRKRKRDPRVDAWVRTVHRGSLYTSVLVLGEVRRGCENVRRRDPAQAERLDQWLQQLRQDFDDRVLPVTVRIADLWGHLNVPDRLPAVDGLLAATAQAHGLTLATRNTKDVKRSGTALVNPFDFEA